MIQEASISSTAGIWLGLLITTRKNVNTLYRKFIKTADRWMRKGILPKKKIAGKVQLISFIHSYYSFAVLFKNFLMKNIVFYHVYKLCHRNKVPARRHSALGTQDQTVVQGWGPTCLCWANWFCPTFKERHRDSTPVQCVCGLHAHLAGNAISQYWKSAAYWKTCSNISWPRTEYVSHVMNYNVILSFFFCATIFFINPKLNKCEYFHAVRKSMQGTWWKRSNWNMIVLWTVWFLTK